MSGRKNVAAAKNHGGMLHDGHELDSQSTRLQWQHVDDHEWHDPKHGSPQKASERAMRALAISGAKTWCNATKATCKALSLTGIVGKALLAKVKFLLK